MKINRTSLGTYAAISLLAIAAWNCGEDEPTTADGSGGTAGTAIGGKAGSSTVTGGAAGSTSGGAGGMASSEPSLNSCREADYQDRTAASADRTISAPNGVFSYSPSCITIKKSQSVSFTGDYEFHPTVGEKRIGASGGTLEGSPNNPIQGLSGAGKSIVFTEEGNFPFRCESHSSMMGVVRVIP